MIAGAERRIALLLVLLLAGVPAHARWLTGEARALEGETIYAPPSDSSPVVLRYYVAEGTRVRPGDVLVRIDPGESASQVMQLESQIEQLRAQLDKDLAELALAAADAELLWLDAEAALARARIDAGIPRAHLSALDADRHAGELQRAERELALKQRELDAAEAAVERRAEDAALELNKLQADLSYHRAQVGLAEQRAETGGVVVHGFDNWRGYRYDEGASAHSGNRIGEVVADGLLGVRAWALEPDRVGLQPEQAVELVFDAFGDTPLSGRIERIAGAPEPKAEWGEGRWFSIDILIDSAAGLDLKPGMSVRVRPVEAHR